MSRSGIHYRSQATSPLEILGHKKIRTFKHLIVIPRLIHNHPSGDPAPSSADVQMTRQIADIAKPLGITVHDHIIVGKSTHTSLRGMKLF